MLAGLLLLFVLLFTLIIFFFVFLLDSVLFSHDLPTSKRAIKALIVAISQHKPGAKNFFDLGCARGTVILEIKKNLPQFDVYGIDNNSVRIFFAKIKAKFLKRKINFQKQDIFQTDLKDADIIYTYLWYDRMPPLEEKLQKELKSGAVVITNTSNFPNWKPDQKIITYNGPSKLPNFETLFVYLKK